MADSHAARQVVVVGGGPAGVAAAMTLARAGHPVALLEQADVLGGKVRTIQDATRRYEHGIHGWWPCYVNFDRLLRWSGIDPGEAVSAAADVWLVTGEGRHVTLGALPFTLPSPLSFVFQAFRTPILGWRDYVRLLRIGIHAVAFDPRTDYSAYETLSLQNLLDYAGVSADAQRNVFDMFARAFCYEHADGISAACALSALRAYVLPSDRAGIPRWSHGLSEDVMFGPMRNRLEALGAIVVNNVAVQELVFQPDGSLSVAVAGLGDPPPAGLDVIDEPDAAIGTVVRASVDAALDGVSVTLGAMPLMVRRTTAGGYEALVRSCTHAGCEVVWDAAVRCFACPCHGGKFDSTGAPIAGPPVRSLDRLTVTSDNGNLVIARNGPRQMIIASDVILATDIVATQKIFAASDGIPEEARHELGHLATTSVIVLRLWFRDVSAEDKPQAALTPTLPMIDAYFCVSKFEAGAEAPDEHCVEVQVAAAKSHYLDQTDEALIALALQDLSAVSEEYTAERVVDGRVLRHQNLFTTFPAVDEPHVVPVEPVPGFHVAGDWTQRPDNSWMMERAVVSGIARANLVLARRGIATVDILEPRRDGALLRLASGLAFLCRSIVRGGFMPPQQMTEQQMVDHDRLDHVMNGWAVLFVGVCNLLPALAGGFDALRQVWPPVFIAVNVYFFLHVEPWSRLQYGSWFRALADRHAFQHRIMTAGGIAVGGIELALANGWIHGGVWRAAFPLGTIGFGVLFTMHHWGEEALPDHQHRGIGFLSMAAGATMGAARFFPIAGMAVVWPVLFVCEAYFFITYVSVPMSDMGMGGGDATGGAMHHDGH